MSKVDGVVEPEVQTSRPSRTSRSRSTWRRPSDSESARAIVRRAEATLLQGIQVGSVFEQQKVFDVIVQGVPQTRRSIEDIRNLLIDRPGGGHVRLGQVADVRIAEAPSSVQREAVSRRLDVVTAVNGRGVSEVAADIEAELAKVDFPMEYQRRGAAAQHGRRGSAAAGSSAWPSQPASPPSCSSKRPSAAGGWLYWPSYPSHSRSRGGFVMMLINDADLSLGAILGLLALVGLAARFAVLLVSTVQSIAESVGDQDIGLAVQQAARQRLRPVIVSSAAVAGFVLPMAVLGGRPGLEILQPMALVLLGGLATTAVVSLLVLPALYGPFSSPRPVAPTSSPELATAVGPGGKGGTGAASGSGNGLHTTQPTSVGSADEGVS
jgi:hypothetical protein